MARAERPQSDFPEDSAALISLVKGPKADLVRGLSSRRREPEWMLRQRLRGLDRLSAGGVPAWASFLQDIDYQGIVDAEAIPTPSRTEAREPGLLAGLGALEASEEAYRVVRKDLESRGVRFHGLPTALERLPDLVKVHFASAVTADDNPLAALNAALWTGGSFLYVPPDVRVTIPLQAEIREDYTKVEPFERNVIVADRGAEVTYIEGCTAPVYTPDQLHISSIEVIAMPAARVRYIALQNFSKDVDNLVTKRARVHEAASVEWVDINLGSRRTWKIPRADLLGPGAEAEFVGVAFAGKGQHEKVGAEMVHLAPRTRSKVANHGIVSGGGRASLRSVVRVAPGATGVSSSVEWSSLMLDAESRAEAVPSIELDEGDAEISQEGKARKISDEILFYMASRGVSKDEAIRMVVIGIMGVAMQRIPVEYAVEVERLVELELTGGIG